MSELHPYQEEAINLFSEQKDWKRSILAPMGCGKTRIAIEVVKHIRKTATVSAGQKMPLIIVCKSNAIPTWQKEIEKWYPENTGKVYTAFGAKEFRQAKIKMALAPEKDPEDQYPSIIINYECMHQDKERLRKFCHSAMNKCIFVCDEWQKVRNYQSKMYKSLKTISHKAIAMIPMSGSLFRTGPQNIFTALQITNSDSFTSYWKFVYQWCHVNEGYFGKEIGAAKNPEKFKCLLLEKTAFISEDVVRKYLPERNRVMVPIEPDKSQKKFIRELDKQLMSFLGKELIVAPTMLSKITRQRQSLCCPKILSDTAGCGPGIEYIADCLEDELDKIIVFLPFRAAIPHLQRYMKERNPDWQTPCIHGGITPKILKDILSDFEQGGDGVLFCTVQFAESFSIDFVHTAFFLGFDWSPDVNFQAEDRIRRVTSQNDISNFYYLSFNDTIDGHVLNLLNTKYKNVQSVTPLLHKEFIQSYIDK